MPFKEPIIEKKRDPIWSTAKFSPEKVPDSVAPILEIMQARALAMRLPDNSLWWEITVASGIEYVRIDDASLRDDAGLPDEEKWRTVVVALLDFSLNRKKD